MPLLLCDLDDTILDRAGAFVLWAETFAGMWQLEADAHAWLVEQDHGGYRPRPEFFASVRDAFDLPTSVDDLLRAFYSDFPALFSLEQEIRTALRRARRQGWRIAIVTNGSPSQEMKILTAGLHRIVDAWCISAVEGCRKPDRRLLEIAAERCNDSLEGAWFVGDAPDADIGAAHAAGLCSIWLRRGRTWTRDDYSPTLEADSFPEAMELLLADPADRSGQEIGSP